MSCIPSRNTRPEILLGKLLRRSGIRHRTHYKVTGKPDFVILSKKIAIFVDGDFWHGHNWKLRGFRNLKAELASYKKFWANKIKNNIKRDTRANRELRKEGWRVIRLWESELKIAPDAVINKIKRAYRARKPA